MIFATGDVAAAGYREKLTDVQRSRVAAHVAAGDPPADVARRYGVHPSTVRWICRKWGLGPRTRTGRPRTAAKGGDHDR